MKLSTCCIVGKKLLRNFRSHRLAYRAYQHVTFWPFNRPWGSMLFCSLSRLSPWHLWQTLKSERGENKYTIYHTQPVYRASSHFRCKTSQLFEEKIFVCSTYYICAKRRRYSQWLQPRCKRKSDFPAQIFLHKLEMWVDYSRWHRWKMWAHQLGNQGQSEYLYQIRAH